jgi:hypothetical protein
MAGGRTRPHQEVSTMGASIIAACLVILIVLIAVRQSRK